MKFVIFVFLCNFALVQTAVAEDRGADPRMNRAVEVSSWPSEVKLELLSAYYTQEGEDCSVKKTDAYWVAHQSKKETRIEEVALSGTIPESEKLKCWQYHKDGMTYILFYLDKKVGGMERPTK